MLGYGLGDRSQLSSLIAVSTALAGMPVRTAIVSINAGRFMVWVDFGAVGTWVLS